VRAGHGGGQRDRRPAGAQGGQRGRGARHRLPGPHRGREEGARDLVHVSPVFGPGSPGHGPRQQGRPPQGPARGNRDVVSGAAGEEPDGARPGQAVLQRGLRAASGRGPSTFASSGSSRGSYGREADGPGGAGGGRRSSPSMSHLWTHPSSSAEALQSRPAPRVKTNPSTARPLMIPHCPTLNGTQSTLS